MSQRPSWTPILPMPHVPTSGERLFRGVVFAIIAATFLAIFGGVAYNVTHRDTWARESCADAFDPKACYELRHVRP